MSSSVAKKGSGLNISAIFNSRPEITALVVMIVGSLLISQVGGMLRFEQWVELTIAGLSLGLILFMMSSGMTLVFGLMGVMNLAHGAFIAFGAYVGYEMIMIIERSTQVYETVPIMRRGVQMIGGDGVPMVRTRLVENGWFYNTHIFSTFMTLFLGILFAVIIAAIAGFIFERFVIKPVYGNALKQILVTMGGGIIIRELLIAGWRAPKEFPKADFLGGMTFLAGIPIEKYRIFAGIMGLIVFLGTLLALNFTKIGLLIRAGVESREMVEVHGYRINLIFIGVFVAAIMLAATGGVFWGQYQQLVDFDMGNTLLNLVIVSIIVGGMGSIYGCFIGSILITLIMNYMNAMLPVLGGEMAAVVLMVAVLMWRPQGLKPITAH
jgi:branched-chain amino acid transport system permease protein